jgi:hypothetical protein
MSTATLLSWAELSRPSGPSQSSSMLARPNQTRRFRGKQLEAADAHWTSIIPLANVPHWLQGSLQQLTKIRSLPTNWDSYGAEAPNNVAILLARTVLSALGDVGLTPTHVDPSAENGVCISFDNGRRYADIECFNTGEVLAVRSARDGNPVVWEIPPTSIDIKATVAQIQAYLHG